MFKFIINYIFNQSFNHPVILIETGDALIRGVDHRRSGVEFTTLVGALYREHVSPRGDRTTRIYLKNR